MLRIMYLGDIMADAGISVVEENLQALREEYKVDVVAAQAENVTHGRGMTPEDMDRLAAAGVDFFTGGNWTGHTPEINDRLNDLSSPVIGPANFTGVEGPGHKVFTTARGQKILFVSLLGQVVGKPLPESHNPLQFIDEILESNARVRTVDGIVVNFHGDYSSEKRVIGYYLDGRVSAVIGDHWHVPTNDAMVLPKGTAHITDVGMCGSLHSSLGISLDSIITRWRDNKQTYNKQDSAKPWQLNAVVVEIDKGLASSITQVQRLYN